MSHLTSVAIELRGLLTQYCAETGGILTPSVSLSWAPGIHAETIRASLCLAAEPDDSVAFVVFTVMDSPTAAKIAAALMLDRHARAKLRAEVVAAERCADAEFEADIGASDASDGEPE